MYNEEKIQGLGEDRPHSLLSDLSGFICMFLMSLMPQKYIITFYALSQRLYNVIE